MGGVGDREKGSERGMPLPAGGVGVVTVGGVIGPGDAEAGLPGPLGGPTGAPPAARGADVAAAVGVPGAAKGFAGTDGAGGVTAAGGVTGPPVAALDPANGIPAAGLWGTTGRGAVDSGIPAEGAWGAAGVDSGIPPVDAGDAAGGVEGGAARGGTAGPPGVENAGAAVAGADPGDWSWIVEGPTFDVGVDTACGTPAWGAAGAPGGEP